MLLMNLGSSEMILILFVVGLPLVLTVYCIMDIMRSTFPDQTNKLLWIIIVLLAPIIGSLLYLVWGRNQKTSAEV